MRSASVRESLTGIALSPVAPPPMVAWSCPVSSAGAGSRASTDASTTAEIRMTAETATLSIRPREVGGPSNGEA